MMNYYIDIIDQVSNESFFVLEDTSRSGVVLAWNGSDKKDEVAMVGSSLSFDLAHNELVDAKWIGFFTGNEVRFKVEIRKYSDDALLWTGFLVPDTYNEPYTNNVTFVKITATCGLGRLKGKYLPDDYYNDEKSVIDIICKILSLTGLEMDLFFNPAIENSFEKSYKNIFLDTESFAGSSKKKDAYAILEILMNDMLCSCFQADGRWNVEGWNQRSVRNYKAKLYDFQANELGILEGLKLIKKITPLDIPYVTMVPPYNMITVTHPRVPQSFPSTIAKEKNEGWVIAAASSNKVEKGEIYSTDWNGNNGYYAKAIMSDYYVSFKKYYEEDYFGGIPVTIPFDINDFINLKNKIFVYKYQKVTIKATFKIIKYAEALTPSDVMAGVNPFYYQIILNDSVLFGNLRPTPEVAPESEKIVFKEGEGKLNFEVIIPEQGLIDVKLYRSGIDVYTTNIKGFEIRELSISPVSFEENLIVTDLINDEYTLDKDIELTYADDDTSFSNCFRLAKLKEATETFNTIEIPVIDSFQQNGKFYSVVRLDGANLIKDNINTAVYDGDVLENLEVIYNYNSSDQMVVKTDFAISTGVFLVNIYKNNDYLGSRDTWLQWTDAIYKIETDRYAKTAANIIRRMYNEPSEKLDVVALDAVKFNDLVLFHYINDKQFVPTNCSWNLDENKTTLTLSRAIYRDSGDSGTNPENIPPIVNAGADIELLSAQTTVSLLATAYDTDGYITSQQWTKLIGGFGDVIMTPTQLATDLQNLTDDIYEYQIQVTDNDGATAFDKVRLIRRKNYNVSLDLISSEGNEGTESLNFKYKFNIDPNIDPSFNLVLKGSPYLFTYDGGNCFLIIKRNNVVIYEKGVIHGDPFLGVPPILNDNENVDFSIGYKSTDEITFELGQSANFPDIHFGSSWIELRTINFNTGSGDIVGLPIKVQPVPSPF
jgi:hypothetical protein